MFSFILDKYLEMKFLGIYAVLKNTNKNPVFKKWMS